MYSYFVNLTLKMKILNFFINLIDDCGSLGCRVADPQWIINA